MSANASASMWNYSLSVGFSEEEGKLLRLALIRYGCGAWASIIRHFPFKKTTQLNMQTQKMFGQQSLREFTHLHLDPKIAFEKNSKRVNVTRKNGVIISKTTKAERVKSFEEYKKLQVPAEEWSKIRVPIFLGSKPEIGQSNDAPTVIDEIESMALLAYRLQQVAYRKQAEEVLQQRGGKGDVNAILEELRIERVKGYQKILDEEELEYQKLLEEDAAVAMETNVEES